MLFFRTRKMEIIVQLGFSLRYGFQVMQLNVSGIRVSGRKITLKRS